MSEELTIPTQVNPLTILDKMVAQGVDPDKLGRVIDLVENWNKNRAVEAYFSAMNRCQQDMPAVIKDAKNQQTNSMYAKLESVNTLVKPVYTENGFSISFSEGEAKIPEEVRTIADVMHVGGHFRQYWIDLPRDQTGIKGMVNKTAVHGKASSNTYAERYLLVRIFNVTIAGMDHDGNSAVGLEPEQIQLINNLLEDCKIANREVSQRFWDYVFKDEPKGTPSRVPEMRSAHFTRAIEGLRLQLGGHK